MRPAGPAVPPNTEQEYLCERYVHDLTGRFHSAVAVFGVTSLTSARAGARHLVRLCAGRWAFEVLRFVRDTLYDEDASRVRTGSLRPTRDGLTAQPRHRRTPPRRPHRDH
ncbi:hypothetical protein AQJ27_50660 [Streptomyces olivochromogenes]|nr:hypothetical protein AQJ27_50660 [Streptomyces olivochromogenes]